MEIGKIYNLEIEQIGDQDTWTAWVSESDKVHYVENKSLKKYDSYTEFTYALQNQAIDMSLDTTSSDLQYQVVFYATGKISDIIEKIEVNGEEYELTDLIDDDEEENITLDQELNDATIGMMLPQTGTLRFYFKKFQAIEISSFFGSCVKSIDQYGALIPYLQNTNLSNLTKFNFDSEYTLKLIYALYDTSYNVYLASTGCNIFIDGINTQDSAYCVLNNCYIYIADMYF